MAWKLVEVPDDAEHGDDVVLTDDELIGVSVMLRHGGNPRVWAKIQPAVEKAFENDAADDDGA